VTESMRPCPCGCGAEFIQIVAEREEGVRADAAAASAMPVRDGNAPRVFLITGMPGAGKSTVARQLALRFERAAHIDIDMVFHHFTVSGRVDAVVNDDERDRQSNLAVSNAAAMARNYMGAGFTCVLEGAVALRQQVQLCAEIVAPASLHFVVLAPPDPVSERRDQDRSGKHVAEAFRFLSPLMHEELHDLGLWIDSSDLSARDTTSAVLNHLHRSEMRPSNDSKERT